MKSTPEDDDVDSWVNRLAGRDGHGTDTETQTLRRAVMTHAARQEAREGLDDPAAADAAWQRMRFRLRRERLIIGHVPNWRAWAATSAVAALVMALAVPMLMSQRDLPVTGGDPPIMRGAPATDIIVPDPLAAAQKAARILKPFDSNPKLYVVQGVATLDFELDAAKGTSVTKDLKNEFPNIELRNGFNRWVFRRAP